MTDNNQTLIDYLKAAKVQTYNTNHEYFKGFNDGIKKAVEVVDSLGFDKPCEIRFIIGSDEQVISQEIYNALSDAVEAKPGRSWDDLSDEDFNAAALRVIACANRMATKRESSCLSQNEDKSICLSNSPSEPPQNYKPVGYVNHPHPNLPSQRVMGYSFKDKWPQIKDIQALWNLPAKFDNIYCALKLIIERGDPDDEAVLLAKQSLSEIEVQEGGK